MKMMRCDKFWLGALVLVLLLPLTSPVSGATKYWDNVSNNQGGTGSLNVWATASNWDTSGSGGVPPATAPGSSDTSVFNVSTNNGARTVLLEASAQVGGMVFTNTGTTTISSMLGGSATYRKSITIGAGGITVNSEAGAVTFGTGSRPTTVALSGSQTWLNNSAALLRTTAGGVDRQFSNLGLNEHALTVDGTGNTTFNSNTMTGSGATAIIKNGAGDLTLSCTNATFSGDVQINGGTVKYGVNNALPSTADVIFNTASGTATLDLNNANGTIATLTLGGAAGTVAAVTTGTGTLSLGGNVTYNAANNPNGAMISGLLDLGDATRTFTIGDSTVTANDLTISAVISSGTAGLIKAGSGTLTFTTNNTYSGETTVNSGTLLVNNTTGSGTGTGSVAVNATLGGSGFISGAVTVNNGGTLAPGTNSVAGAILSCTNGLTLAAGSSSAFDCTASECDSVAVTGALAIQGSHTVVLTLTGEIVPKTFTLFTFDSVTGDEHLTSWDVTGLPDSYFPCVRKVNNSLVVKSYAGTVLRLF